MVFETSRLIIRAATIADAPFYYNLWTNPEVMTLVGFPQGLQITQAEIENKIHHSLDSVFSQLLLIMLKSTGEVIGECKMKYPVQEIPWEVTSKALRQVPDLPEDSIAETDVKLLPAFWGHKYGVEVKKGLVDYLFSHTECAVVKATPNVKNIASIKMQESVGGVRVGEGIVEFPDAMQAYTSPVHHYVYYVYRSNWRE